MNRSNMLFFTIVLSAFITGTLTTLVISGFKSPANIPQDKIEYEEELLIPNEKFNYIFKYINENSKLTGPTIRRLTTAIIKESDKHKIQYGVILSLMEVESHFKQYSVSNAGALGFMQIIPRWHYDKIRKQPDMNLYSPETNVAVGTKILKDCIKRHRKLSSALLCYNGSQRDVTRKYAKKIFKIHHHPKI